MEHKRMTKMVLNTNKINTACKTLLFKSFFIAFYMYLSNYFLLSFFDRPPDKLAGVFYTLWIIFELKTSFRNQEKYFSEGRRISTNIKYIRTSQAR